MNINSLLPWLPFIITTGILIIVIFIITQILRLNMGVPKKKIDGEFVDISESGNWNVAIQYSLAKIMFPLAEIDKFERIARFGTVDITEKYMPYWNDKLKSDLRIEGMHRLICELMMLITNVKFAIRKEQDKDMLIEFYNDLEVYRNNISKLYRKNINQQTKQEILTIFEDKFENILNKVIQIKMDINEPLNKADLIFSFQDVTDPSEMKRRMMEKLSSEA